MGIPREIAQHNLGSNFLFSSGIKAGPGDYNVDSSLTTKKVHTTAFGKIQPFMPPVKI